MAQIKTPAESKTINTLAEFLTVSGEWHQKNCAQKQGMLSDLWYRGVKQHFDVHIPGVYRNDFTDLAVKQEIEESDPEERRLYLERCMISQFRTTGAQFLDGEDLVTMYFLAQHHGMPTRLLDWSTNPLAGLFFCMQRETEGRRLRIRDGCGAGDTRRCKMARRKKTSSRSNDDASSDR